MHCRERANKKIINLETGQSIMIALFVRRIESYHAKWGFYGKICRIVKKKEHGILEVVPLNC